MARLKALASALAVAYLSSLVGCAFNEPPQSIYTANPEAVLAGTPSTTPENTERESGTQPGAAPPSSFGSPGTVPPGLSTTPPGTPRAGGPPTNGSGTMPSQQMPQFEQVDPTVLQDRLASIAEALMKYTSQNGGKLPEFTSGGSFRKAIVALMPDESAWPPGTMIVPRAISGMNLQAIPNRSETPLLVAGPLGTDGKRYAIFADLSVREVPEQAPPPSGQAPPTGVDF